MSCAAFRVKTVFQCSAAVLPQAVVHLYQVLLGGTIYTKWFIHLFCVSVFIESSCKKSHASFRLSTTSCYGADHSHLNPFSICWPTIPLPSCSSAVCLLDNRLSTCWGSSSSVRQAIVVMCRWFETIYFFIIFFLCGFMIKWNHDY